MEHTPLPAPAPQKFVSPETWALARRDYLAGETAAVVARRYGIGIDNVRKRQINEGWTRKAQREAKGPGPWPEEAGTLEQARAELERATAGGASGDTAPPGRARARLAEACARRPRLDLGLPYHPGRALCQAVDDASRLVGAGRHEEAQDILKAAERLARLTGRAAVSPETQAQEKVVRETALLDLFCGALGEARRLAVGVLGAVLAEEAPEVEPWHRAFVYRARAAALGAERMRADFEAAREADWSGDVWTPEGRLRALEDADAALIARYGDRLPRMLERWARAAGV